MAALAAGGAERAYGPASWPALIALTLFGALPDYRRVARESRDGEGSIAMLERALGAGPCGARSGYGTATGSVTCRRPAVAEGEGAKTASGPRAGARGPWREELLWRQLPSSLRSLPPLMAILRGLACSATGIRSLSTPAS
ncbi:hypothetical protein GCM10023086_58710 [Streptomyces venetus]|uniref:Uncharacterized protein n=1 Tax=Streptomyces venetus TaxID=1701086 RepID=A0ABP8GT40_9ACTN